MSFTKRLGFYLRGQRDAKAGVRWCPYTPNSTEAYFWQRGFQGKKRPVNQESHLLTNPFGYQRDFIETLLPR